MLELLFRSTAVTKNANRLNFETEQYFFNSDLWCLEVEFYQIGQQLDKRPEVQESPDQNSMCPCARQSQNRVHPSCALSLTDRNA